MQVNTPVTFGPFPFPPVLQRALVLAILQQRDCELFESCQCKGGCTLLLAHEKREMNCFLLPVLAHYMFLSRLLEIFIAFHMAYAFLAEELYVSSSC